MSLETYLLLHQAKTIIPDSRGSTHGIGRDEVLNAGAVAAKKHPLGHTLFLAENGDEKSLNTLIEHAKAEFPDLFDEVVSVAMGKPTSDQWARLVRAHPLYSRERKRAGVMQSKAKLAERKGNIQKRDELLAQAEHTKTYAIERCKREILATGSCPACRGDGMQLRKMSTCPTCKGTGKIIPDDASIRRLYGDEVYAKFRNVVESLLFEKTDWIKRFYSQINCEKCS